MQSDNSITSEKQLSIKPLFVALSLFVVLALFIQSQFVTITPRGSNAPAHLFSSERAFNLLAQLTKEQVPHPVDSVANRVVEQRIVNMLRDMGYQEEIQHKQMCRDSSRGFSRCTLIRNIIVEIPGTTDDKGILLAAHYDSVPAGPGGSDAGAAVGTLLEIARLLKLEEQPRNTIVLLFNEGEEFGLFGAKAFMEHHPLAKKLKLALNVEARGSTGKSVMFETGEDSGWLVKHYAETTPSAMSSSLFYEVYKALPNDTDLTIFKEHGLQGLNFAHAQRLPHYHTPLDNLANLDRGSLQHHGDNVWGILKRIKDQDLNNTASGNLVYTDILGLFVVKWSEPTSLWLSLICLLIFVVTGGYSLKKQKSDLLSHVKSHAANLGIIVLVLISSAVAAYVVLFLVKTISGYYAPWHANQLPMQLAVWFSAGMTGLIVAKSLLKPEQTTQVFSTVSLLWIVLSIATSIWLAGISFLFIVPAIVATLARVLFTFIIAPQPAESALGKGLLIVNAFTAAVMFMPIAYIVAIMIGYGLSVAIGVVIALIVIATLPLLTFDKSEKSPFNLVTYATTAFAIVTIGWTGFQAPHSEWLPQRLNLNYVQNSQGEAFVQYGSYSKIIPPSLTQSFEKAPEFKPFWPWNKRKTYVAQVPVQPNEIATNPMPSFNIIESKLVDGNHTIKAQLSAPKTNLSDLKLYIPVSSGLVTIQVGEYTLNFDDEKGRRGDYYIYHCRGQSCADISLTMNFKTYQSGTLYVASAYPILPKGLSQHVEARGRLSVPSQNGDQSIWYSEYAF